MGGARAKRSAVNSAWLYPLTKYHLTPLLTAVFGPDNGAAGNHSEETVHQDA
jgi:hypothetical protein